jgi:hypothetical protein
MLDLDGDGDTSERVPVDLAGQARFVDVAGVADTGVADPPLYPFVVDMGAYEYQSASGDVDGDGDVDLDDFAIFGACVAGPDVLSPPVGCEPGEFGRSDLDGDADVDLVDFTAFQRSFGG